MGQTQDLLLSINIFLFNTLLCSSVTSLTLLVAHLNNLKGAYQVESDRPINILPRECGSKREL